MENVFEKLGIGGSHTLQQVRASIDTDAQDETGFIPLLEEHHDFLKESIKVIMDSKASIPDKREHLSRFFNLLEMHAKAEQETLYVHLQQNTEEEARLEGLCGQDEHDIAFQLKDELLAMNYKTQWNDEIASKAKVVATLVKNHIKEEESIMFSIAKNDLTDEEMEQMRLEYIAKCRSYLLH
jgi:hemerythrin-like domain-containing protein